MSEKKETEWLIVSLILFALSLWVWSAGRTLAAMFLLVVAGVLLIVVGNSVFADKG